MAHIDLEVALRWADLDGYRHVNNTALVRLLEEARIQAFWPVSEEEAELGAVEQPTALTTLKDSEELQTYVASHRIEYKRTLGYHREGVIVRLWISRIGGASIDVDYQVLTKDDPEAQQPYAIARSVLVQMNPATQRPQRLGQDVRDQLEPWMGSPLVFRS
ncbi:acyl-CoA thioesterase [Dermabacteraceae bacterium P13115]|nr:thioesterase family protein [Dermabacteraceae bacterium TAE3-ERU5]